MFSRWEMAYNVARHTFTYSCLDSCFRMSARIKCVCRIKKKTKTNKLSVCCVNQHWKTPQHSCCIIPMQWQRQCFRLSDAAGCRLALEQGHQYSGNQVLTDLNRDSPMDQAYTLQQLKQDYAKDRNSSSMLQWKVKLTKTPTMRFCIYEGTETMWYTYSLCYSSSTCCPQCCCNNNKEQ